MLATLSASPAWMIVALTNMAIIDSGPIDGAKDFPTQNGMLYFLYELLVLKTRRLCTRFGAVAGK